MASKGKKKRHADMYPVVTLWGSIAQGLMSLSPERTYVLTKLSVPRTEARGQQGV